MNVEPRNFDRDALVSTLRAWELSVTSISYLPVGAGAHHYLAVDSGGQRWFVTVDGLFGKLLAMLWPFGVVTRSSDWTVSSRRASHHLALVGASLQEKPPTYG